MWDLIVSVPDHCLSFYFTTAWCRPFFPHWRWRKRYTKSHYNDCLSVIQTHGARTIDTIAICDIGTNFMIYLMVYSKSRTSLVLIISSMTAQKSEI